MRMFTEEEFQAHLEELLSASNNPVKTPCPHGAYVPRCMYFYYVSYTRGRVPEVKVYFYDHKTPLAGNALVNVIRDLTKNARMNEDVPPKCATIFEGVHWQCKSYFVIIVDDDEFFIKDSDAVVFDDSSGKTPNHTFFDGVTLSIPVGTELVPALACVNHMFRDAAGAPLNQGERQYFIYNINVGSRITSDIRREDVIDPGGTNLGPPITPP